MFGVGRENGIDLSQKQMRHTLSMRAYASSMTCDGDGAWCKIIEFMITRSLCTLSKQAASTTRFAFQMRRVRSLHRTLLAKLRPGFNSSCSVCEILERHLQLATKLCKKPSSTWPAYLIWADSARAKIATAWWWRLSDVVGKSSNQARNLLKDWMHWRSDDTAPIITSTSAPDI